MAESSPRNIIGLDEILPVTQHHEYVITLYLRTTVNRYY